MYFQHSIILRTILLVYKPKKEPLVQKPQYANDPKTPPQSTVRLPKKGGRIAQNKELCHWTHFALNPPGMPVWPNF